MEEGKRFIIKILIVLISVYFIDGGRSILLVSSNIEILFDQDHSKDFDVPHQHHLVSFGSAEKWLESFRFDFYQFNINPVKFLFSLNTAPQEFLNSIWQPPKFI